MPNSQRGTGSQGTRLRQYLLMKRVRPNPAAVHLKLGLGPKRVHALAGSLLLACWCHAHEHEHAQGHQLPLTACRPNLRLGTPNTWAAPALPAGNETWPAYVVLMAHGQHQLSKAISTCKTSLCYAATACRAASGPCISEFRQHEHCGRPTRTGRDAVASSKAGQVLASHQARGSP